MYFMHYSRVFMILVSADLYKSVFSTYYFIKLAFCLSVSLAFSSIALCFEQNVILKDLITFIKSASMINHLLFNFVLLALTLYKRSVWQPVVPKFNLNHRRNFKSHLNFIFDMKMKSKLTFQIDIRNQIDLYFYLQIVFDSLPQLISRFIDQVRFN